MCFKSTYYNESPNINFGMFYCILKQYLEFYLSENSFEECNELWSRPYILMILIIRIDCLSNYTIKYLIKGLILTQMCEKVSFFLFQNMLLWRNVFFFFLIATILIDITVSSHFDDSHSLGATGGPGSNPLIPSKQSLPTIGIPSAPSSGRKIFFLKYF